MTGADVCWGTTSARGGNAPSWCGSFGGVGFWLARVGAGAGGHGRRRAVSSCLGAPWPAWCRPVRVTRDRVTLAKSDNRDRKATVLPRRLSVCAAVPLLHDTTAVLCISWRPRCLRFPWLFLRVRPVVCRNLVLSCEYYTEKRCVDCGHRGRQVGRSHMAYRATLVLRHLLYKQRGESKDCVKYICRIRIEARD